jgi:hypothetical protein
MDRSTLDERRRHFGDVATTIGEGLSAANPHVVALVAKWDKADLVPGLSDMDFRIVCDDDTTVDDWVEIDRFTGRLHLEMVRAQPQWNRINEHTAGAGLTISEALGDVAGTPEQSHWSLWWGRRDWFDRLKAEVALRPFTAADEHYHLGKFLHYYSPYIHGIDPPINLGTFEPKYALHSRSWHYFAPPMLSAASLLARKHFSGKRAGLAWLRENGYVVEQVDAVFHQVNAHYETPEQTGVDRLQAFEDLLFAGFEELLPRVVDSVEHLDIDRSDSPAKLKRQLASSGSDAIAVLMENVRSTRIRAGRYFFLANAPEHFDARPLVYYELPWIKEFYGPVFDSLRTLLGDGTLDPQQCLGELGMNVNGVEEHAIQHVWDLASRSRDDHDVPLLFQRAIDWFPHYYRLIEGAAARVVRMRQTRSAAAGRIALKERPHRGSVHMERSARRVV